MVGAFGEGWRAAAVEVLGALAGARASADGPTLPPAPRAWTGALVARLRPLVVRAFAKAAALPAAREAVAVWPAAAAANCLDAMLRGTTADDSVQLTLGGMACVGAIAAVRVQSRRPHLCS